MIIKLVKLDLKIKNVLDVAQRWLIILNPKNAGIAVNVAIPNLFEDRRLPKCGICNNWY